MKNKRKKSLPAVSRPVFNPRPIITEPDGQPKPVPKPVLHPRTIIEAQVGNLYLVIGTLTTLYKALCNSDGDYDLAYADCVKSCNNILEVSLGALDDQAESLPKQGKAT